MYRIQELMREQNMEDLSGVTTLLPPLINSKYKSIPNCTVLVCVSCQIACAKKKSLMS